MSITVSGRYAIRWNICTKFADLRNLPLNTFQIICRIFFVIDNFHFFCIRLSVFSNILFSVIIVALDFSSSVDLSFPFLVLSPLSCFFYFCFVSLSFIFPFTVFSLFFEKMSTSFVPVSPVPNANMTSDPIVVSNDAFDALDASLVHKLKGSIVNVQPVDLSCNYYEAAWLSLEQFGDPTLPLPDIQNSPVKSPAPSMRALELQYRNEMIIVTLSMECNPTDSVTEDGDPV